MPHEIKLLEEDHIILVRRYGDIDLDDVRLSLKRVVEMSEKESVQSALIDTREISSFPTIDDIYKFSTNLPSYIWFAIVLPTPNSQQQANAIELEQIFEIQGSLDSLGNIGRDYNKHVRVFERYGDAVQWLKENA